MVTRLNMIIRKKKWSDEKEKKAKIFKYTMIALSLVNIYYSSNRY